MGAGWMVAMRLFDRGLGVISTIILARLLVPADYGLIAMATGCVELLSLIAAFGFDSALIQKPDTSKSHFDTAWTLNVLFGLSIGVTLFIGAPFAARYFGELRLVGVMQTIAAAPVLNGFANIGIVLFRKELKFHLEAAFMAARRIFGFSVTLAAALWFRSYWALVAGTLAAALAGLILSYVLHSYRPRLTLSERADLFGFSAWLFANSIVRFASTRALEFVIAKQAGSSALGLFSMANEISSLPTSELSAPINRALFPGYARLQENDVQLRRLVLDVFAVLSLLAVPAGVGIAALAPLLVRVMLGANWLDAVPLIQTLAFSGAIAVLQNNSYLAYLAKGRPRTTTWIAAVFALTQLVLVVVLLPDYGVLGVACGILGSRIALIPIESGMLMRVLAIRPRALWDVIWRPLCASLVMWFAVTDLVDNTAGLGIGGGLPALLGIATAGALTFAAMVLLLWRLTGTFDSGELLLLKLLPGDGRIEHVLRRLLRFPANTA